MDRYRTFDAFITKPFDLFQSDSCNLRSDVVARF